MLNARAIAVQGVGFGPRLTAVQGLSPFKIVTPPTGDIIPYGSGRLVRPEVKRKRRDRDDDVLLFMLH